MIADGSHNVAVTGNIAAAVATDVGSSATLSGNTLVQNTDPTIANYYNSSLITQVDAAVSATVAHTLAENTLAATAPYVPTDGDILNLHVQIGSATTAEKITAQGVLSQMVVGDSGSDTLVGGPGNDTLVGGAGNDYLTGSAGNNILIGGTGADQFVFSKTYPTSGSMDTIADFSHAQGDKINVHSIDANIATTQDDDFKFIGTQAFDHTAGELRYYVSGGDAYVQGDVNGDGVPDFTIKLMGVTSLVSADFML